MNQRERLSGNGASYHKMVSVLVSALFLSTAASAFDSGSTGMDGVLSPVVDTEISLPPSGVLNYTSVNIPLGVTVTFRKNAANTPVYILASGDITVAGMLSVKGEDGKDVGAYGDGVLSDDGLSGKGGPGGFDGGRGGRKDTALTPAIIRGGAGLGPGGGAGGIEGNESCSAIVTRYYQHIGTGGAYASDTYANYARACGGSPQPLGKAYGSELLQPLIGGSGGGGGRGGSVYSGSGGGGGGGALLLAASGTLTVSGTIEASGGDAGGLTAHNTSGYGGYGAGGSGGAVRLVATNVVGKGKLYARGGCIRYNNQVRQYCGWSGNSGQYGGSPGRVRIEGENITFNGTADPQSVTDIPGPLFITEGPGLRITSVAGQVVPPNPSGNDDITLPEETTGPIVIGFQTTNIPVGNTVLLRVAPAYGEPIQVLSPAISGSTASGTASVSVVLPQGASTLQASVSYTVAVAGELDLSRFAQNEPVEKVHVTVALAGETLTTLETVSGRRVDVPYSILRAAGFQG